MAIYYISTYAKSGLIPVIDGWEEFSRDMNKTYVYTSDTHLPHSNWTTDEAFLDPRQAVEDANKKIRNEITRHLRKIMRLNALNVRIEERHFEQNVVDPLLKLIIEK